ncbi:MAG: TatD family hydrolase, partial [bacterium]|nr:TatD family hydrolase [bacterium]
GSAHEETIRILMETYGPWPGTQPRGMIHCYSGTWDQAQRYLALGFNISFTGVITFKPTKKQLPFAEELWRVVREVPMDRFLVETDCPYLTPEPHRGERNEPRYVRHVAERVADLKGVSFDDVAAASVENTFRLFRKIHG